MSKKVVIAMSGGVDSSVCAGLLKEKGYTVIGVTMQIWEDAGNFDSCCGLSAVESARRVADILDIPHYVVNFRDVFRKFVIEDFCDEYGRGRTPNPCIRCNQHIKFSALKKKAEEINADFISTGHYARIEYSGERKRYIIKKGADSRKDQSYVLYTMTQEQLEHTLLPLGEFTKDNVRERARELSLPVADRPDSQEICFIPLNDYTEFLKSKMPDRIKRGSILNREGQVLGEHKGIMHYTIGQRERIGLARREPLYVISIDEKENTITVGKREEAYTREFTASGVNFIAIEKLTKPLLVKAKIRYSHPEKEASVEPVDSNTVQVVFKEPQFAVTPGQAVVFYDNDTVIGGGTIDGNHSSKD